MSTARKHIHPATSGSQEIATEAPARDHWRVLSIARDLPYFPGGHGGNTRTFALIRELARDHRLSVVSTIYTPEHVEAAKRLAEVVDQLRCYQPEALHTAQAVDEPVAAPSVRQRMGTRLAAVARQLHWLPLEVRQWEITYANLQTALANAIASGPHDLVQIECSDNALWAAHFPFRGARVLVVQDVKTVAYWRLSRTADGWATRAAALAECLRFYAFERRHCRAFDHLIAMSDADAEHLRKITGHESISVVPNGVDTDHYRCEDDADKARVVFTATMNHPPNHDGIKYFVREIWPLIQRRTPEAVLDIVGSNPPEDVRRLRSDSIRVTGFVPDTRPYLAAATVFICPLRFASGTRLKILEAMAMGKPVVSTGIGAEGIAGDDQHGLHRADTPALFADRVVELLADPQRASTEGGRARRFAEDNYSWRAIAPRMEEAYSTAVARYRREAESRQPRIGLNGMFLVAGGQTGGLEPYFHNLVSHLLRLDGDSRYVLVSNPSNELEFTQHNADNLEKHTVRNPLVPMVRDILRFGVARLLRMPATPRLPRTVRPLDLDILHSIPGYLDDFSMQYPCVLTIADIQHEYCPEFFTKEDIQTRQTIFKPSAERAIHIIAISEFTKRTLIERFGTPADKISVVHLGVGADFLKPVDPGDVERVRKKYSLRQAYCFYPANLWPHKNHRTLLRALASIPPSERPQLVLTGSATPTGIDLNDEVKRTGTEDFVTWLGFIDRRDLPGLYAGAEATVFPSLFEGFGIPAVEAMATGCPLACSDTTSLPEITGDAALRFDPNDPEQIAASIVSLRSDQSVRGELRERGLHRARQYNWKDTALKTLKVYRRVLADRAGTGMSMRP